MDEELLQRGLDKWERLDPVSGKRANSNRAVKSFNEAPTGYSQSFFSCVN